MKRKIEDKLSTRPEFDSMEEVAFWHDPDAGVWLWQYTLYDLETRQFISRRLGQLELTNPQVGLTHLRRALISDQKLGAFIPNPDQWEKAGRGENAGWVFRQKQLRTRAEKFAARASQE